MLVACAGEEAANESPPAITEETLVDSDVPATEVPAPTEAPVEESQEIEEPVATSEPVAEAEPAAEAGTLPLYLSSDLVDVNSNESFRIADLTGQGKYVLVEMMAVW